MDVLKAFPALRVNLAHFGGFDEAIDPNGKAQFDKIKTTWEWTIGDIWRSMPDGQAYADLSYFNEILDVDACKRNNTTCMRAGAALFMKSFRTTFPESAKRLIYGSDWVMTGLETKFPSLGQKRSYPEMVAEFLVNDVGYTKAEVADIMFNNAVRFLGLDSIAGENSTRARLEKFYEQAGLDRQWLKVFG